MSKQPALILTVADGEDYVNLRQALLNVDYGDTFLGKREVYSDIINRREDVASIVLQEFVENQTKPRATKIFTVTILPDSLEVALMASGSDNRHVGFLTHSFRQERVGKNKIYEELQVVVEHFGK